jgi:hypothetical protein|tara:strand:+ start:2458 stop:2802 length:345 start_codon:yes stop_codon:yes gene_type:complete
MSRLREKFENSSPEEKQVFLQNMRDMGMVHEASYELLDKSNTELSQLLLEVLHDTPQTEMKFAVIEAAVWRLAGYGKEITCVECAQDQSIHDFYMVEATFPTKDLICIDCREKE